MNIAQEILESLKKTLPDLIQENNEDLRKQLEESLEKKLEDVNKELVELKKQKVENGQKKELTKIELSGAVFKGILTAIKGGNEEQIVKAMGENVVGGGVDLVFDKFATDVSAVFEQNNVVALLSREGAENTRKYIKPKFDGDSITSYKITENGPAISSQATTSNLPITINKRVILTNMSEEILKDNMTIPTLYDLLVRTIGVEYSNSIEKETLVGTGLGGDIEGIMVDANVNIVIMDAGKTSFLDLFDVDVVKLVTTPEDKYGMDNEFVFVMHKSIKGLLMGMRDLTGALIYPELRTDGNILGYPVITSSKMPKLTDDAPDTKFIAFGNFKHIILAENGSEEILLGYNGDGFANGTKTLRAYKRDGLGILYPKAFAVLKTALV